MECSVCKKSFNRAERGRNPLYCSDAHKMRAYRARKIRGFVTKKAELVTKQTVTKCKGCTSKSKFCSICGNFVFKCICP